MSVQQPPWRAPVPSTTTPTLSLYNSLTRKKEPFVPINGRRVTWYNCGPTVYDASHMGHARVYLTFDIVRRVLEDWFNYEVLYVMNITDIDDKIIVRARQNFLFTEFKKQHGTALTAELLRNVEMMWLDYARSTVLSAKPLNEQVKVTQLYAEYAQYQQLLSAHRDQVAKQVGEKFPLHSANIEAVYKALRAAHQAVADGRGNTADAAMPLIGAARDVIAPFLDRRSGHEVTDHSIFRALTQYWENEYFADMHALNVRSPDVLTRVTEYVPEIVAYVQKIIANGYAYESQGSVYFDVDAFKRRHDYAKLAPWSAGHTSLLMEGEGALGANLGGKKSVYDFALWKASKPGEPIWDSPWGKGRPGWHIECSVMASDVTGPTLDIHSGGIDLCFPHHDNELAQTEAYYEHQQWVNYFLHAGHLHIDGQKMSKSLKNFITIKEALSKYTPVQMRLMVLMHAWNATLDYKDDTMTEAVSIETTLRNFFESVKARLRERRLALSKLAKSLDELHLSSSMAGDTRPPRHNYHQAEKDLQLHLSAKQDAVHAALCDNINTQAAMTHLLDLVTRTNVYVRDKTSRGEELNVDLLEKVARYVQRVLTTFGVMPASSELIGITVASPLANGVDNAAGAGSTEDVLMPVVDALATFRDEVRALARQSAAPSAILQACDRLRDDVLPEHGISLEDSLESSKKPLIKFVSKEVLLRQRQERAEKERQKREQQAAKQAAEAQRRRERLERGRTPPEKYFRTAEYSSWDGQGLPLNDAEGVELAKSRRKKLAKELEQQVKLNQEYLAAKERGEIE